MICCRPMPSILSGQAAERRIEVFNGGLFRNQLALRWSAHWDKPDGDLAIEGTEVPCEIEPGFHATKTIAFTVPRIDRDQRKLCLVLESVMDGRVVFRSEETCLNVIIRKVNPPDRLK